MPQSLHETKELHSSPTTSMSVISDVDTKYQMIIFRFSFDAFN